MKKFTEEILEKEVVFPKNFTYTKTNDGFILNTLSGIEFFRSGIEDKLSGISKTILLTCFLIFMIIAHGKSDFELVYLVIPTCIGTLLWAVSHFMKKIKTTFIVTPKGIEIKSKKNSLFVEKENIANIYASQAFSNESFFESYLIDKGFMMMGQSFHLKNYKVCLVCKEPILLSNTYHRIDNLDLFNSHFFYTEKSVLFLVQEFIRVLDLKLDVIFMNGDEWIL